MCLINTQIFNELYQKMVVELQLSDYSWKVFFKIVFYKVLKEFYMHYMVYELYLYKSLPKKLI